MTEQPTEPQHDEPVRVAIGQGNPHGTIRRWVALAILIALVGVVLTIILIASRDIGWWPYVAASYVVTAAALGYANVAQARHHEEMEAAIGMFANIATESMRENSRHRGEDPKHAWQRLADQIAKQQEQRS